MSRFTVSGREINYNGGEFAVIVAPLSGRMRDGIDALNGVGYMDVDDWNSACEELKADLVTTLETELTAIAAELWIPQEWQDAISERVADKLCELVQAKFFEE